MTDEQIISQLNTIVHKKTIPEMLAYLTCEFPDKVLFSTSFGQEDQVITDLICRNEVLVSIFTLDTGRLFHETYQVFNKTIDKYGRSIKVFFPEKTAVETMVTEKGPLSFYKSVDNRKECCNIRKVEPLHRALEGAACWVTGLRAGQSNGRQNLDFFEYDPAFQVIKYNPLLHWSIEEVKKYITDHNVPYNSLHDKGFVSIGCAPCTRAVNPGEDIRAGRWWWENNTSKECGLHSH